MSQRILASLIAQLTIVLGLLLTPPARAQHKVDLAQLVRETQQQSGEARNLAFVWWIPVEFWQVSLSANGALTPQQIERFSKVVSAYFIVAAVDGTIGPMGGAEFSSESDLRARIRLVDAKGRSYAPIADDKISPDMRNFTQIMRPMLTNLMGSFGASIRFFMFPARDAEGREIANARADGSFDVMIGDRRFHWRLPLGSLMEPKVCPEDGEVLNGAWSYCPWHGTKLKAQAAPATEEKKSAAPPPKQEPVQH
jgi:hypothetical protein